MGPFVTPPASMVAVEPGWTKVQRHNPELFQPEMWAQWKADRLDIRVHVGPLEFLWMKENLIHDHHNTNVVNVKRTDPEAYVYAIHGVPKRPPTIDLGIYTTRSGWAGSREPSNKLGQVTLSPETARLLATALTEQADAIQAEIDAEKVAGHVVTVFIPADRAGHPEHAKNLMAKALNDYHGHHGPIGGFEVEEVQPMTVAEKKKRGL